MPEPPLIQIADEAHELVKELVPIHHQHLVGARILCIFTSQTKKKGDRVILGSAAIMNPLQKFLASGLQSTSGGFDFVITLDSNQWPDLTDTQKHAAVFHELAHCMVFVHGEDGWKRIQPNQDKNNFLEWKYGIVGHDFEGFSSEIKKFGFWRNDETETEFADAVRQLALPGMKILAQSRN